LAPEIEGGSKEKRRRIGENSKFQNPNFKMEVEDFKKGRGRLKPYGRF
jgi:hypothetical protein